MVLIDGSEVFKTYLDVNYRLLKYRSLNTAWSSEDKQERHITW